MLQPDPVGQSFGIELPLALQSRSAFLTTYWANRSSWQRSSLSHQALCKARDGASIGPLSSRSFRHFHWSCVSTFWYRNWSWLLSCRAKSNSCSTSMETLRLQGSQWWGSYSFLAGQPILSPCYWSVSLYRAKTPMAFPCCYRCEAGSCFPHPRMWPHQSHQQSYAVAFSYLSCHS